MCCGNVLFGLKLKPNLTNRQRREIAEHYLRLVELERFRHAYVHELSGGMKQRVAIARALAPDPEVLLMDEPFAALDALTRRKMQEELLQLWDDVRFTVIFVTHSIEEAVIVGSRILVLSPHPGQVRAELNAHGFGQEHQGGAEFQALCRRISAMLFEPAPAGPPHESTRPPG